MSREEMRINQLKAKIDNKKSEKEIYRNSLAFVRRELCDLENELSILEAGGTVSDVQNWKNNQSK